MRIVGAQRRNASHEQFVHTELVGGRLGTGCRTSMPLIKLGISKESVILRVGLRKFRIPLDKILYVQTEKRLIASELKVVHSQPDVPAAINILSFNPRPLLDLISSLGIRIDDRARLTSSAGGGRLGAYVQAVGGLLLVVAGVVCLVALTVWAMKKLVIGGI